jgi:uncharacterized membrane protein HdeD (DUF308 family)
MIEVMMVEGTAEVIHGWAWFLAHGVVLMLLGIPAIVRSATAAVVSLVCLGWTLMFASAIEFVGALLITDWTGVFLHLSMAVILGISGVIVGHAAEMGDYSHRIVKR